MAIFDSSIQTGRSWMAESFNLFKTHPRKWILIASLYIALFMIIPSLPGMQILSLVAILGWPIFMVFAISMFRNADNGVIQNISEVISSIKPKVLQLIALGGVLLIYSELISLILNSDIEGLSSHMKNIDAMTDSQAVAQLQMILPLLLKLTLSVLPVIMITWFSPMLIAFNNYTVVKAVKSSIAGSLQYLFPLIIAWLILTFSIFGLLLFAGIVMALIGIAAPALSQLLMPLFVLCCLFFATSLMFAFQYVSYRDIFRAA
jgi:hypothetical protein